jgi:hypothetical protein
VLEGELENNTRKPRNLVRKWDSLKRVKLDEVADDEDDDVVRTSVSQN